VASASALLIALALRSRFSILSWLLDFVGEMARGAEMRLLPSSADLEFGSREGNLVVSEEAGRGSAG